MQEILWFEEKVLQQEVKCEVQYGRGKVKKKIDCCCVDQMQFGWVDGEMLGLYEDGEDYCCKVGFDDVEWCVYECG